MRGAMFVAAALGATACNARLIRSVDRDAGDDDAEVDVDGPVAIDAPPDAPLCTSGRKVWLAFDGITLQSGSPSDATQLRASWTNYTSAAIPPYHDGQGTRAQDIDAIKTYLATTLAPYHIDIVTAQPAAGPYVLIAFGGTSDDAGTQYSGAVNQLDCMDGNKNDVAWVSGDISVTKAADYAIGAIGYGMGLTATNNSNDCMCSWANNCQQTGSHCTIAGSIATNGACSGQNTQDEAARFAAFCN